MVPRHFVTRVKRVSCIRRPRPHIRAKRVSCMRRPLQQVFPITKTHVALFKQKRNQRQSIMATAADMWDTYVSMPLHTYGPLYKKIKQDVKCVSKEASLEEKMHVAIVYVKAVLQHERTRYQQCIQLYKGRECIILLAMSIVLWELFPLTCLFLIPLVKINDTTYDKHMELWMALRYAYKHVQENYTFCPSMLWMIVESILHK